VQSCQHYPTFQLTDAWGQLVTFTYKDGKFYRHRAETDPVVIVIGTDREISQATFALAMLKRHEEVADQEQET
jgi:hypothetical protein